MPRKRSGLLKKSPRTKDSSRPKLETMEHMLPTNFYDETVGEKDVVFDPKRFDGVDSYEYELPEDFEDEEIDEDMAFTEEDYKRFGHITGLKRPVCLLSSPLLSSLVVSSPLFSSPARVCKRGSLSALHVLTKDILHQTATGEKLQTGSRAQREGRWP